MSVQASFSQCNTFLQLSAPASGYSYITVNNVSVSGNHLTVEAIFNATTDNTLGQGGDLVSKHLDSKDVNYLLRPYGAQITTDSGFYSVTIDCGIQVNKTYHIAMVYDGNYLMLYRNGILAGRTVAHGNLITNAWPTRIGYQGALRNAENFYGYINEVRIWNVARSATDIQTHMMQSLPSPATITGLLAYYNFDNLTNKQGNASYNGIATGNTALNITNPTCSAFTTQQCVTQLSCSSFLRLTNQGDAVTTGDLDVSGSAITVEAIFKRTAAYTSFSQGGTLVSKHSGQSDANYLLRPNAAAITTSTGYYTVSSPCDAQLNQSYHVAMVYDGKALKLYRNNQLVAQTPASGTLVNNNIATRIGNDAWENNNVAELQFKGYIDEVRIWSVARTAAELQLYNASRLVIPASQSGLIANYVFSSLNNQAGALWNGTASGNAAINSTDANCTAGVFSGAACDTAVTVPADSTITTPPVSDSAVTTPPVNDSTITTPPVTDSTITIPPVTDSTQVNPIITDSTTCKAYPNPATQTLVIEIISVDNETAIVKLISFSGMPVRTQKNSLQKGVNKIVIEGLASCSPGIYFINIVAGKQKWKQKVIIVSGH